MNEHLEAIWKTLDDLAWSLNLSRPDTQDMLTRNRALMLTYVDLLTQNEVIAQARQAPSQPTANSAANGRKPGAVKA